MRPDDDINIAGLVLERYKYRSRGGARALATGDDARRPRRSAAGKQFQFIGGGKAQPREVRRPHLDAVSARVLNELRGRVETHRLAVQERGEKGRRLVALEPGGNVGEQRETHRV